MAGKKKADPLADFAPADYRKVPVSLIDPWDKNPRGIKTEDFERLKRQILDLGLYKPLLCYEDNGRFVVLGGNMRIRAIKELGLAEVAVSIVHPKDEAEKIKYALSDNDRAGFYDSQQLAELVMPHMNDITLPDYKVDLGEPWTDLKRVVEQFGPDVTSNERKELKRTFEVVIECPDEEDQEKTYNRLTEMGMKCRLLS